MLPPPDPLSVVNGFLDAFNAGDIAKLVTYYADDVVGSIPAQSVSRRPVFQAFPTFLLIQPRSQTARRTLAVPPRQARMAAPSSTDSPSGSGACYAAGEFQLNAIDLITEIHDVVASSELPILRKSRLPKEHPNVLQGERPVIRVVRVD